MKNNYQKPEAELIELVSAESITDGNSLGASDNTHEDVPDDF